LGWGDGYFSTNENSTQRNEAKQFDADQILRRKVLRELHDLCHPEEDLREVEHVTDQEWFYLLSMSWNFPCGEGIPGRAFQFGQHIWICDTVKPINFQCARLELAKVTYSFFCVFITCAPRLRADFTPPLCACTQSAGIQVTKS
ncbi:hypothetical protein SELMODRAFT_131324, partial [Selaginella moellendorffii]